MIKFIVNFEIDYLISNRFITSVAAWYIIIYIHMYTQLFKNYIPILYLFSINLYFNFLLILLFFYY